MPNVQQIIKGHNQSVLENSAQPIPYQARERACNCRKKEQCPLEGNCLSKGIVYQAQVTSVRKAETYVGVTATEFKARFRNHQVSFNNATRKNTSGSLKVNEQRFTIKWKILAKAKPYSKLTKGCNLCTTEKHLIITRPELTTLNKRKELISTCRHPRKFILRYS